MTALSDKERKEICEDYKKLSIEAISIKFKISSKRVKEILKQNDIPIKEPRHSNKEWNFNDFAEKRFPSMEGYHYIAKSHKTGEVFKDYLNLGGSLTVHIKNYYKIFIPPSYKRMAYVRKEGKLWHEQWFDIVLVKDEEKPVKKCPYCNWTTIDVENKSGMFLTHILKEHGITKEEHLKQHPEDKEYLMLASPTLQRQIDTDPDNFVVCPICGMKFRRIDGHHLKKHNMSITEFKEVYTGSTVSVCLHNRMSEISTELNKNIVPVFESRAEKEIKNLIKSCGIDCRKEKAFFDGMEIDIFIPDKMIGIEYDGIRYHTEWFGKKDKWYHLNKTKKCAEKGVKLIHIFEDEYERKKDIVENKIKHLLGVHKDCPKVRGHKCVIKEIDKHIGEGFLEKFHIQGSSSCTVCLGAYYNDALIAVMQFKREKGDNWELTRLASDYHYKCEGVGGKLFKTFVKKYNPSVVKSFADRRWTIDEERNIYIQLGFKFDKYTNPDYHYVGPSANRIERLHKFGFRKQILHRKYGLPLSMTEVQMVKKLKYDRIWDCGLIRYVWKAPKKEEIKKDDEQG